MTHADYEAEIAELAAQADPLRVLLDDDPAKEPLQGLVDQINALRHAQATADRVEVPQNDPDEPVRLALLAEAESLGIRTENFLSIGKLTDLIARRKLEIAAHNAPEETEVKRGPGRPRKAD